MLGSHLNFLDIQIENWKVLNLEIYLCKLLFLEKLDGIWREVSVWFKMSIVVQGS